MHTIQDLMRGMSGYGRISYGNALMVWDGDNQLWVVLQRKEGNRLPVKLYAGDNEAEAVNVFAQAAGIVEEK